MSNPFPFKLERLWKDPESDWHPVENPDEVYETLKLNYTDIDGVIEQLDNGHEVQTMGAYYRKDTGNGDQAILDDYYSDMEDAKS